MSGILWRDGYGRLRPTTDCQVHGIGLCGHFLPDICVCLNTANTQNTEKQSQIQWINALTLIPTPLTLILTLPNPSL